MSTPYLDNLREGLTKEAGGIKSLLTRLRLGREFPRLALWQQMQGAKQMEQMNKLHKANKVLSVLGGAGGMALVLDALGALDLGKITGRGRPERPPMIQPPTVIHY